MARRTWTDEQREHALAVYADHGPAEAARRTGIPKGTIAAWANRREVQTRVAENLENARLVASMRWAERRSELADQAGEAAAIALAQAVAALQAGNDHLAKAAGVVFGIAVDKAQLLTGEATSRTEMVGATPRPEAEKRLAKILMLAERRAA